MEKKTTYEDLGAVPENNTGEIISGKLIVTPDPSWKDHLATTLLNMLRPVGSEEGIGNRRWTFRLKPRLKLGDSVLVPDLAGWKTEGFPSESETNNDFISAVPGWICEIFSDETVVLDKTKKMPLYARHGVAHLWLIDPQYKSLGLLRVYKLNLESGQWIWLGGHFDEDKLRAEPFQEIELDLGVLLRRLAVMPIKKQTVSKSVILSRLRTALEKELTDREPEEPPSSK